MTRTERDEPVTPAATRWARIFLILAAILGFWSILAALTGGIRYDIGPLRLSSRTPVRPALVAVLFAVIAWRLAYEGWLELRLHRLASFAPIAGAVLVTLSAVSVLAVGFACGIRVAGGADSFGYVSESELWRRAELRIDQSFAQTMPWPLREESFAPLGYRLSHEAGFMVPIYAPGLPLLMAAGRWMGSCGPYYIGPVCGAALVVLTYFLGRRFFSRPAGVVAAVLTAAAPVMLYMSIWPMADVPAATLWASALLASGRSPTRALAAGVLTGIAVAIRPNLVPLAMFPWLLTMPGERNVRRLALQTMAFAAGVAPFAGLVAWTNSYFHGSPFLSGYGSLAPVFALDHARANLRTYPAWWLQSQGALAFLFAISAVQLHTRHRREARILMAFSAAVFLSYLFYVPFEAWWFLRFLLPAVPLAFLFCADAVQWATAHLSLTGRFAALLLFAVASLTHTVTFNRHLHFYENGEQEQRYVDAGVFVDRMTPPNAVILSMQHSGSIRYYSGRLTLRYDWLDPVWLDRAIEALERGGRPVYLLLDDWEEPVFRKRFAGQRSLGQLDRGPAATGRARRLLFYPINAAPYDRTALRIPRTQRSECVEMSPGFVTAGRVR